MYLLVPGVVAQATQVCPLVVLGFHFLLGKFWSVAGVPGIHVAFVSVYAVDFYCSVRQFNCVDFGE
jgi:hypothetical protein